MKQHTLFIEQMQNLQKLGLDTSDASMCWVTDADEPYLMVLDGYDIDSIIPAYTLQDILEKLPNFGHLGPFNNEYRCVCHIGPFGVSQQGKTMLEASYKMLIWCLENGYIKTK